LENLELEEDILKIRSDYVKWGDVENFYIFCYL
jgi:hypothetical protein